MRWLLVLVALAGQARADDYEDVDVVSVSSSVSDPEGGFAGATIYATGYMDYAGHKSCCGFKPAHPDGWYRLSDTTRLQAIFDAAATAAAYPVKRGAQRHSEGVVELADGTRVEVGAGGGSEGDWWKPSSAPPNNAKRLVVGRRLEDPAVRDVFFYGPAKRVKALSHDQRLAVLRVLAKVPVDNEFAAPYFVELPVDLVVAQLGDAHFAISAIVALGSAAGKPYVKDIAAAAKTPEALVAAAHSLVAIGTSDAHDALARTILPALVAGGTGTDTQRAVGRIAAYPRLHELASDNNADVAKAATGAIADLFAALGAYVKAQLGSSPRDIETVDKAIELLAYGNALPTGVDAEPYVLAALAGDKASRAYALAIAAHLVHSPSNKLVGAIRALANDKDPQLAGVAQNYLQSHAP